jgi:anti-sigma B factor antagonist
MGRPLETSVAIEERSGVGICRLAGDLDAAAAPLFREAVSELCAFPNVAIDLSGVPFIDSAGLGALVSGVRRIREVGGQVALFGPRPTVGRLIRVAGFDRVAPLHPDLDAALAELDQPIELTG